MAYTIQRLSNAEWLVEREKGIGSSEATTLMGVSHYDNPYQLFMRKTHRAPAKESSEQMELGHHLEPAVASRFAELTGAWIDPESVGDWLAIDTEKEYLRVSPDRIWVPQGEEHVKENWRILECKTTGMSVDPDSVPDYWYCQIQYQMGVMGIRRGALAWISSFPVLNFGYREVEFNPSYYAMIVEAIDAFWNGHIMKDIAPEPTELEDLRAAYPLSRVTVKGEMLTADASLQTKYRELSVLRESIAEQKKRETELKEAFEAAMMGYGAVVTDEGTVIATRGPKEMKQKLDSDALRADYPAIWEKYARTVTTQEIDEKLFKKECRELYGQYLFMPPPPEEPEFKLIFPRKKAERKVEKLF